MREHRGHGAAAEARRRGLPDQTAGPDGAGGQAAHPGPGDGSGAVPGDARRGGGAGAGCGRARGIAGDLAGHEKGAYTGAERRRAGVFERAGMGILFLDEIGDMPLALQSRLLRVLQSRSLTRIGGTQSVSVPARVVCATHQDLGALVRAGRFREDLYYRIRVLDLRLPPLRERPEDVLWLAERFVAEHGRRFPQERRTLHGADRDRLLRYPWPGNVRELHHALERACIMG
ncbi:sigma 54-interacting transcriptional regulator [Candidatus Thiodictyon syntrophicum]|uniref:sigma 54-interacting transcriptional regulator n=1 Tax=Candidatus Thiodictyon syntrophicum TaxID=1166950 RepID=UPI003AB004FB